MRFQDGDDPSPLRAELRRQRVQREEWVYEVRLYRLDNRRFFLDDLLMSCSRSYEGGIETRFLDAPDHYAAEAWERMTYGGLQIEGLQFYFERRWLEDTLFFHTYEGMGGGRLVNC